MRTQKHFSLGGLSANASNRKKGPKVIAARGTNAKKPYVYRLTGFGRCGIFVLSPKAQLEPSRWDFDPCFMAPKSSLCLSGGGNRRSEGVRGKQAGIAGKERKRALQEMN